MLIGVDDKVRRWHSLDQEERLASLISDSTSPRLVPDLEILSYRKAQILAVHVYLSSLRPHHLKREGEETGTYVRVGSTNRRADRELREEVGMRFRVTFGLRPTLPSHMDSATKDIFILNWLLPAH